MEPILTHRWDLNESEAVKLQQHLSSKVILHDPPHDFQYVAGVDVAYHKASKRLVAAAVILDAGSLEIVEKAVGEDTARFPYIPGLFSFRELPPIIQALKQLRTTPDLIVCDGQGQAHPRRFGLACHLGVLYDLPVIGCGKTKLIGEAEVPSDKRGDTAPLLDRDEVIGHVLRTQDHVKPIYVSVGHRTSLRTACDWILKLTPRYRLPETTHKPTNSSAKLCNTLLSNRKRIDRQNHRLNSYSYQPSSTCKEAKGLLTPLAS